MNAESSSPTLALYYYNSCPFCVMVVDGAKRMGVDMELRNIHSDDAHYEALHTARGRTTVPVLRITKDGKDQWMPESRDIMDYLKQNYG